MNEVCFNMKFIFIFFLSLMSGSSLLAQEMIYIEPKIETNSGGDGGDGGSD
jgi:hypothetical protein